MSTPLPKISIVILNWNGKNDTLDCLDSLRSLTYPQCEVIIVDNGSSDGSALSIREQFPKYVLIETGKNLGFAEGNNVGIRHALKSGANYVFLLNNDTVVSADILDKFLVTFDAHPEAGILGAKIYLHSQRDTLDHLGGIWNPKTATFEFIGLRQKQAGEEWLKPKEIDYVCGAGLIVRREVFEKIGYLEPRYFLIWEESDFCFRARKQGYKTLTCPDAKLWHKVSASFVGGKPHSTYFWWRNRLLWIERNAPKQQKWRITLLVLIPEVAHMCKIYALKNLQLFFNQRLNPKADYKEKKLKLLKNKAALCGVRDYILRRFGDGPSWIYGPRR